MLQLIVFITREFSAILFIESLTRIFPTSVVVIKYYYFYLNTELVSLGRSLCKSRGLIRRILFGSKIGLVDRHA